LKDPHCLLDIIVYIETKQKKTKQSVFK